MDFTLVLTDFRIIAAEFIGIDDSTVLQWIELTSLFVSKRKFKRFWGQALALLTAHRMKLAEVGTDVGNDPLGDISNIGVTGLSRISNYSEGEVSIGFNNNIQQLADMDAEYALTQYGVQYLSLLRMLIMSITSAGEV